MAEVVPLVSICCIAYNQQNYIEETIQGFLIQKTNFAIEIIIHDDASTDDTAKIINEYAAKHPNLILTILSVKHGGPKCVHFLPKCGAPRSPRPPGSTKLSQTS
jgi:glycosyltransferase involved in cell wall biosynthesis